MRTTYAEVLMLHALEVGNGWAESVASGTYILTRVEPALPRPLWLRGRPRSRITRVA